MLTRGMLTQRKAKAELQVSKKEGNQASDRRYAK